MASFGNQDTQTWQQKESFAASQTLSSRRGQGSNGQNRSKQSKRQDATASTAAPASEDIDSDTPRRSSNVPPKTPSKMPALAQGSASQPSLTVRANDSDAQLEGTGQRQGKATAGAGGGTSKRNVSEHSSSTPKAHHSPRAIPAHVSRSPAPRHATPLKQAYAGPTFHASPAASSLPIPKFFSKSVPAEAPQSPMTRRLNGEGGPASPSPGRAVTPDPQAREESPLDFFFKAHKAEQSRHSSLGNGARQGPFTPPPPPPPPSRPRTSRENQPMSGKAMFMMELDGAGPADDDNDERTNATPFTDRMVAASEPPARWRSPQATGGGEGQRAAQSAALKKLLMKPYQESGEQQKAATVGSDGSPFDSGEGVPFKQQSRSSHADVQQHAQYPPVPLSGLPRSGLPRSPLAQRDGPRGQQQSKLSGDAARPSVDVKTMEDDLRRMLKLGPSSGSNSNGTGAP